MTPIGRIKSFPYPERIDSLPSIEDYLKKLYRSLTEEQVEKITDFEDMDVDSLEVSDLTISTSIKPTADATVDLGAVGTTDYRFRHLYLSGNLSDETNTLTVANAKSAYTHSQIAGGNSVHVSTTENTQWDGAYTHSQIAGGNSVHVSTTENTNWDAAHTHISNNGTDHSYIDQSVISGANVIFGTIASGDITVDAKLVFSAGSITDGDGAISFGDEDLTTTGKVGIGAAVDTNAILKCYKGAGGGSVTTSSDVAVFEHDDSIYFNFISPAGEWSGIIMSDDVRGRGAFLYSHSAEKAMIWAGGAEILTVWSVGNIGVCQSTLGTNATKTLALGTGVAPTTSPTDCFQMYSADVGGAAGEAGVHFRDETGLLTILGSGGLVLDKTTGKGIKIDTGTPTFGWRDLLGKIRTRGVGGTDPNDATYSGNIKAYQFSVNDECWVDYHIPHDYVPGTDIFLHFHWSHNSAIVTGGSVTWGADITYAKGHDQAAFSTPVNITVVGNASTTQYQHIITEIQISASTPSGSQIDTDNLEPDGVIMIRGYLSANDITSSGAVPDPFLHFKDIHYQSTNIATKNKAPDFYA